MARTRLGLGLLLLALLLLVPAATAGAAEDHPDERGARALRGTTWSTPVLDPDDLTRGAPVHPVTPPLANVYTEPSYYADGCHVPRWGVNVVPGCTYGDPGSTVRVAMIGDSKVGGYFESLEEIAWREGWSLRTYTKSACGYPIDTPMSGYPECDAYNEALTAHLDADPPDIVITGTQRRGVDDATVRTWEHLRAIGVQRIVALWDLPVADSSPAPCVAEALTAGTDLRACASPAPDSRSGNPSLRRAAEIVPGSDFVDLRDWVCPQSSLSPACPAVLGRVQVYGQGSHMSVLYASTLTDPVHQRLHEIGVAAHAPWSTASAGRTGTRPPPCSPGRPTPAVGCGWPAGRTTRTRSRPPPAPGTTPPPCSSCAAGPSPARPETPSPGWHLGRSSSQVDRWPSTTS